MNSKLSLKQVEKKLEQFPGWGLNSDNTKLISGFEFKNFNQVVTFVNAISRMAEVIGHHPDLYIFDYKYLQVLTSTHDVEGFTEKDFLLMKAINKLNDVGPSAEDEDTSKK